MLHSCLCLKCTYPTSSSSVGPLELCLCLSLFLTHLKKHLCVRKPAISLVAHYVVKRGQAFYFGFIINSIHSQFMFKLTPAPSLVATYTCSGDHTCGVYSRCVIMCFVPTSCVAPEVKFEIDLPKRLVWIESERDVEFLTETLKKCGKEVKYNGVKWNPDSCNRWGKLIQTKAFKSKAIQSAFY